jgi:prepilin-type N-terminal cleavage/methylation domain-containing protein
MIRIQKINGLTLVEILVAIAIVVLLSAGLYVAGDYADKQAKIKQTQSTIEMLSAALEQYRDSNDCFPFIAYTYKPFKYTDLQSNLQSILGGTVTVSVKGGVVATDYNNLYASDETLYYYLNRNPASRKIISSINSSLITNKDYMKREYFINYGGPTNYPLLHFVDAWNFPFRYTYKTGDNFPVITSAGPNRVFEPNGLYIDDITSR